MIREKRWFPILYMFLVTVFFSTVIIGFTRFTGEQVEANQKLSFESAVIGVLPELSKQTGSGMDIHGQFTENILPPDSATAGAYTFQQNGRILAYILPVSGQGFWAPIQGVLGIQPDRRTITGIAFYEQNETPGLGAEIAKMPFRQQFSGLILAAEGQPIRIRRPDASLGKNEVHAVTGATQTSTRLEKIINSALQQWRDKMEGIAVEKQE